MSRNFAQIVEEVKHLSLAEKEDLLELLRRYVIEQRREDILQNCEASLEELRNDKLTLSGDIESLRAQLSRD